MGKAKLNQWLQSLSGTYGDLVFSEVDGQIVVRTKGAVNPARSPAQMAQMERFRQASAYAKLALANPGLKTAYRALCHDHLTPYNLAVRDFLTPPQVKIVHLDAYTGQPGQGLRIEAWDDFEVVEVEVAMRDPDGQTIETGWAERNPTTGEWTYVSQVPVAAGRTVLVEVMARDHPGHVGDFRQWYWVPL